MEYPRSLFPGFHHEGPIVPGSWDGVPSLGWGGYGRVQEDVRDPDQRGFIPLYSRRAERWGTTKPTPLPLLPPNTDCGFSPVTESDLVFKKVKKSESTDPKMAGVSLHFSKQVGRFCWDQSGTAFRSMGRLLEPHFYLGEASVQTKARGSQIKVTRLLTGLQNVPYHECPQPYSNYPIRALSFLTGDWLQDVPPALLAEMVNDGMADEWKQLQFQESLTGGALCWAPYPSGDGGCLIYPRGAAMNQLHFQQMRVKTTRVKIKKNPAVYDLQHRVLQISTAHFDNSYVGVRSLFNVAAWSFSPQDPPTPLSVVRTTAPSTCVNVSPHLPGELCVSTESGALYLWNLENGLQLTRQEDETLFFRDDPRWRWGDFTSHPRVLLYADRTGVQAADTRVEGARGLDLFRIGQESSSQRGERVILPRCLRETQAAHFLVTTQFSVYIMDERLPLVPLAKWTHMLERPPAYVSVIAGGGTDGTDKILLGTQHSQETVMLQYSGGDINPCQLHLPAFSLPRSLESLDHLDPLPLLQRDIASQRLASPMAGLAAASMARNPALLTVFQLTESGDVFTQQLRYNQSPASASRRNPSPAGERTLPEVTSPEEVTIDSDASGQEPGSGPGAEERPSTSMFPPSLSKKSKVSFHKWIRKLVKVSQGSVEVAQRPGSQVHKLFSPIELRESPQLEDGLRDCLRQSMRTGKLPKLGSSAEAVEVVRTDTWKDPLSQRLTAAWEGRLAMWWADHLGLNKLTKIQALREKRRRQKLQRTLSQSSVTGSLLSSFSFGSDVYETEASSPRSHSSAPMSEVGTSVCSGVSKTQGSAVSVDQASTWSFQAGPSRRSVVPNVGQERSQATAEMSSQGLLDSEPCAIISSKTLRSKGIPREKRRTLRDFINFFGESREPSTGVHAEISPVPTPSHSSQTPSRHLKAQNVTHTEGQTASRLARGSQELSESFQPETSSKHSRTQATGRGMQTRAQPSLGMSSSQNLHEEATLQGSQMQTRSQLSLGMSSSQTSQTFNAQSSSQQSWMQTLSQGMSSSQTSHAQSSLQDSQNRSRSQLSQGMSSSQSFHAQSSSQMQTLSRGMSSSQTSQTLSQTFHSQSSSQRSQMQTRFQRPPAKKYRMGF